MRWVEQLRFDANGLIPAVIQDADSGQAEAAGTIIK